MGERIAILGGLVEVEAIGNVGGGGRMGSWLAGDGGARATIEARVGGEAAAEIAIGLERGGEGVSIETDWTESASFAIASALSCAIPS